MIVGYYLCCGSGLRTAGRVVPPEPAWIGPLPYVPAAPSANIDGTLTERHSKYGSYVDQCSITQDLKTIMHCSTNWAVLPADMKESLDMIASKISRILNGDPSYVDSWHDISGYARLIEKRLQEGDKE